ncbi:Hypothetical_protein [Hexamita inflata]|uniref:Hypothetical_protein n=1 Tax=Hexamita inflata TaxID=28002 RepID=A0AA86PNR2_9EUKA|nr:Hypothetical protein HINF_LOCUS31220 [Hexamita inflata]
MSSILLYVLQFLILYFLYCTEASFLNQNPKKQRKLSRKFHLQNQSIQATPLGRCLSENLLGVSMLRFGRSPLKIVNQQDSNQLNIDKGVLRWWPCQMKGKGTE